MALIPLTDAQRDELRCIAQTRAHDEQSPRNAMRDLLSKRGLIIWWVDPVPTSGCNESRWQLTGLGRQLMSE